MTVTQIVRDLLEHNMITMEAATVLLQSELKASMFDSQVKNTSQVFQPYHGIPNSGTINPYYVFTTSNDPIIGTTAGITPGANELLKVK